MTSEPVSGAADDDAAIAVRVRDVTKTYGIWSSPKARLAHPLLTMASQMMPFSRVSRSLEFRTRHMYRDFHALQGVSLDIRKGEAWGFIGVNGSGKSTLLKIISGNLRPSSGFVEVDGKVAILDYGAGFNGEFTGRENVYLKASIMGISHRQIDERFDSIAAFADIGDFMEQPVKTYSSGMSARLGFAIMAHVDADIMITDEALAVGDAFFVQKCMRHIHSFLKKGTFLFVSHSVNDVMTLCDKAVWLERGHVVEIGKASEVCKAYQRSVELRTSQSFLEESVVEGSDLQEAANGSSEMVPSVGFPGGGSRVHLDAAQLAALLDYHAPASVAEGDVGGRCAHMSVLSEQIRIDDLLASDEGVGGARIFSVNLVDDRGQRLGQVSGGEMARLKVSVVAEIPIKNPIIGFQLKNERGLTLIAENTYYATKDNNLAMHSGNVVTAQFCFRVPLLPVGDYAIRIGFAAGEEARNALLDVRHEALVLHCSTSGSRHGLVGLPLVGVDVEVTRANDSTG
jgi:lipopolysaccharide transport system ATP-binding protein